MNATPTAGCTCYLSPGNFLSNEPGYYKAGDFGIRLENILEVVEADSPVCSFYFYYKLSFTHTISITYL